MMRCNSNRLGSLSPAPRRSHLVCVIRAAPGPGSRCTRCAVWSCILLCRNGTKLPTDEIAGCASCTSTDKLTQKSGVQVCSQADPAADSSSSLSRHPKHKLFPKIAVKLAKTEKLEICGRTTYTSMLLKSKLMFVATSTQE